MNATTARRNTREAQTLLQAALVSKAFEGFSFDTFFRLRFAGGNSPQAVEFSIEGEWWFGSRSEWPSVVQHLAPPDAVQPDEPVKAYFLALLRWTPGAIIADVTLSEEGLEMVTQSGSRISISSHSDASDFAWRVEEPGVPESEATWLVSCTGEGELYARSSADNHPE